MGTYKLKRMEFRGSQRGAWGTFWDKYVKYTYTGVIPHFKDILMESNNVSANCGSNLSLRLKGTLKIPIYGNQGLPKGHIQIGQN